MFFNSTAIATGYVGRDPQGGTVIFLRKNSNREKSRWGEGGKFTI